MACEALGCHRAKPIRKLLEGRNFLLLVVISGQLLFVARRTLHEVVRVIAGVGNQLLLRDLMNLAHNLVHKLAVMRNQQQRARIILQVVLQPKQRRQIEVVRRFVQQEQVGFEHQQPGQTGAHDPAAAHLPRFSVEIRVAKTEASQHLLRLCLHFRVVELVVLGMCLQVFWARHIPYPLQLVQPLFQTGQFVYPAGGHVQNRFLPERFALVRQVAHHGPFVALHGARVRLPLLENDGEQRGFARAVRPHQREVVAIIDVQRGGLKESPPAKSYLKITNSEHEKAYSPATYRHHLERSLNNSAEAEAGSLSIAASWRG